MSDLSGTEKSIGGDNDQPTSPLILKPAREAGKVNSGGYNLESSLGWTKKRFVEFEKHIKTEVTDRLDLKLQDVFQSPEACRSGRNYSINCGIKNRYENSRTDKTRHTHRKKKRHMRKRTTHHPENNTFDAKSVFWDQLVCRIFVAYTFPTPA